MQRINSRFWEFGLGAVPLLVSSKHSALQACRSQGPGHSEPVRAPITVVKGAKRTRRYVHQRQVILTRFCCQAVIANGAGHPRKSSVLSCGFQINVFIGVYGFCSDYVRRLSCCLLCYLASSKPGHPHHKHTRYLHRTIVCYAPALTTLLELAPRAISGYLVCLWWRWAESNRRPKRLHFEGITAILLTLGINKCPILVGLVGLEPTHLAMPEPKSGVYTNFTTSPWWDY